MIFIDSNLHEIAETEVDIDIEYGTSEDSTNDFELTDVSLRAIEPGGFYIPNTEIGGLIDYEKDRADHDYTVWRGFTWRGLLSKSVLMPPSGSNYLIVSGEANDVISSLISGRLGDIFKASDADSGCTISSYQFPLYINLLDGIEGMLEYYGYRLDIKANKVASGQPIQIVLAAKKATLLSGTFNEDNGIPMAFEVDNMGINHLICGGPGELQNRMIRHLFIGQNGEVTTTQYYFGLKERTAFFDYPSAESEDDLIDASTKQLLELASHKTLSMESPEELELEIGDIVQGMFPDGTLVQSPVVRKIYKIENGTLNMSYKVKGEE